MGTGLWRTNLHACYFYLLNGTALRIKETFLFSEGLLLYSFQQSKLFQRNKCYVWQVDSLQKKLFQSLLLGLLPFYVLFGCLRVLLSLAKIHNIMTTQSFVYPLLCLYYGKTFHLLNGTSLNGDIFMAPSLSPLIGGDCIKTGGGLKKSPAIQLLALIYFLLLFYDSLIWYHWNVHLFPFTLIPNLHNGYVMRCNATSTPEYRSKPFSEAIDNSHSFGILNSLLANWPVRIREYFVHLKQ